MWAFRARFIRPGVAPSCEIKQRIGIEIGAENTEAPFGDAWRLEALQFVAQRAVALLRRVEVGKPLGWIRRRGRFSQRQAGIGDAGRCEDERRDMRRRDARPGRLLGIGDHRRGDGRFGFRDRVRIKAGPKIARQSESGEVEAVVAGALELRERRSPRVGQAVFADPNRRVGALGVEGRDRGARGAPVAAAERVAVIVPRDEPPQRRLKRALHRRERRPGGWVVDDRRRVVRRRGACSGAAGKWRRERPRAARCQRLTRRSKLRLGCNAPLRRRILGAARGGEYGDQWARVGKVAEARRRLRRGQRQGSARRSLRRTRSRQRSSLTAGARRMLAPKRARGDPQTSF